MLEGAEVAFAVVFGALLDAVGAGAGVCSDGRAELLALALLAGAAARATAAATLACGAEAGALAAIAALGATVGEDAAALALAAAGTALEAL